MQLPQHWWSDRSEATLISTSLTSTHVRLVAVPSNSGIRKNSQTFTQFWRWLLKINLVSAPSSQSFVERLFSACAMLTVGKRNRMDKSLNMRAWLKVNHDSLVDMGMWTHWTVLQTYNCYAQRWTTSDTLSAITAIIIIIIIIIISYNCILEHTRHTSALTVAQKHNKTFHRQNQEKVCNDTWWS